MRKISITVLCAVLLGCLAAISSAATKPRTLPNGQVVVGKLITYDYGNHSLLYYYGETLLTDEELTYKEPVTLWIVNIPDEIRTSVQVQFEEKKAFSDWTQFPGGGTPPKKDGATAKWNGEETAPSIWDNSMNFPWYPSGDVLTIHIKGKQPSVEQSNPSSTKDACTAEKKTPTNNLEPNSAKEDGTKGNGAGDYATLQFPVCGRWAMTAGTGMLIVSLKDEDANGNNRNRAPVVPAAVLDVFKVGKRSNVQSFTVGFATGEHTLVFGGPALALGNDGKLILSVGPVWGDVDKRNAGETTLGKEWRLGAYACISVVFAKF